MSRIGKVPVVVPAAVDVSLVERVVTVKGPKGTLTHTVPAPIEVSHSDGTLVVTRPNDERASRSLHGLTRTLLSNLIAGVTDGYEKKLEIVGTGYRVVAKGRDLEFALGFSHSVTVTAPEGITFAVESPTKFSVSGIDKQQVGEVAANIRKIRKPEPYKARACDTRASRSAARSERLVSSHGDLHQVGRQVDGEGPQAPPPPHPQAHVRNGGASAPRRHPVGPSHRRPDRGRRDGHDARLGVLARG